MATIVIFLLLAPLSSAEGQPQRSIAAQAQVQPEPTVDPFSSADQRMEYDALMARADAEREAGSHATAAALYADAYRARPPKNRADLTGEITIRNAIADYQLAIETNPGDVDLLKNEAELLREFIADRGASPVPADIMEILHELDVMLAAHESPQIQARHETPPPPAPTRPSSIARTESPMFERTAPQPVIARDYKVTVSLLVVGVTAFAGGVAGISGGAWMLTETRTRYDAYVAAAEAATVAAEARNRTEEQRQRDQKMIDQYYADLHQFERGSRARATSLTIVGAILTTTGIGLMAWGAVRARGGRPQNRAAFRPALARERIGLEVTVGF